MIFTRIRIFILIHWQLIVCCLGSFHHKISNFQNQKCRFLLAILLGTNILYHHLQYNHHMSQNWQNKSREIYNLGILKFQKIQIIFEHMQRGYRKCSPSLSPGSVQQSSVESNVLPAQLLDPQTKFPLQSLSQSQSPSPTLHCFDEEQHESPPSHPKIRIYHLARSFTP